MKARHVAVAVGVAAVVMAGAGTWARAQDEAMETGPGGARLAQFLIRLNVTDAQQTQIADLLLRHGEALRSAMERSAEARRVVAAAVHAETFNEQAVRDAVRAAAAVQEDFAVERARLVSELRPILTPDQQVMIKDAMQEAGGRIGPKLARARGLLETWVEVHRTK